jgi:hypothetical protein
MKPLKDASQFYEVERRVRHAERPWSPHQRTADITDAADDFVPL